MFFFPGSKGDSLDAFGAKITSSHKRIACKITSSSIAVLSQVWDLRARKCVYTIPSHRSLISSAHFEHSSGGQYIVTGGYDGLVKVWFVYMCVRLRVYGGSVRVHASLRTHASTCLCETHVLYLWHGEQAVAT